jgi:hypothetical protein
MLSTVTSGELDRQISMLSSSGDSEVEFYMHITIQAGLSCTLFNTAGMHALMVCRPFKIFGEHGLSRARVNDSIKLTHPNRRFGASDEHFIYPSKPAVGN